MTMTETSTETELILADDAPLEAPSTDSSTDHVTVLVADDDPDLLALMTRRLVKGGYRVVTATDGQQAIELAVELRPDLVLLDVMMPKLTGPEVTALIRANPATREMKVILVSAGFQRNMADHASMAAGADSHIVKPFDRTEPVDRIRAVLNG
jgi:two-component system phosphate regulon response regulator PhoB